MKKKKSPRKREQLRTFKKSFLSIKNEQAQNIRTRICALIETLQGAFGMLKISRSFKKALSVELSQQK